MEREIDKWITVNGNRVPVYKDNVKVEKEYASNLTEEEKRRGENAAKLCERVLEDLTASHNKFNPDEDLEDYIWQHIYDSFGYALPSDMSVLVFDNNGGQYDRENGKIGLLDLRINTPDERTLESRMSISYAWMDDLDDDELEMMGIYK